MILQALYRLAKREGLMEPPDYEPIQTTWLVRISEEGQCLGISETNFLPANESIQNNQRTRSIPKYFLLPRERARTSGDRAFFLFDKAEYVFGIDPDGKQKPEKLSARFDLFRERVKDCLSTTGDDGIRALDRFLEDVKTGRQTVTLPKECAGNDLFTFVYDPDIDRLLVHRPVIRSFWEKFRIEELESVDNVRQCLVTGTWGPIEEIFPSVKRVPGGSTSGVALVSFNKNAFESHGWKGNENAPMSRQAAEASATALKRLLYSFYPDPQNPEITLPKRNLLLSADTAVCYWTAEASAEEFADAFGGLMAADPESVKKIYQSVWKGKPPEETDASAFYALTISGTQGRAIIRDWFESTVAEVAIHIAEHFQDINIVWNTPPPRAKPLPPQMPLPLLLQAMAVHGDRSLVPTPWIGEMLRAALLGAIYPLSFMQRALERYRAEICREKDHRDGWRTIWLNDARAALIKAVINRWKRKHSKIFHYQEVKSVMDPHNKNDGYVLGQLMAVLEKLQSEALGQVNATIVDKYFSGGAARPRSVFVHLLRGAENYIKKMRDDQEKGGAINIYRRQIGELVSRFDANLGFPASLDLHQQGLFVIGYHQMKHWLWMNRDERAAWEKEHPDAPRPFLTLKEIIIEPAPNIHE